jgi:hypothetical protein
MRAIACTLRTLARVRNARQAYLAICARVAVWLISRFVWSGVPLNAFKSFARPANLFPVLGNRRAITQR